MQEVIHLVPHTIVQQFNAVYLGYTEADVRNNHSAKGYNPECTKQKLHLLEAMKNPQQSIHVLFPGDIDHDDLCKTCTLVREREACDDRAAAIRSGEVQNDVDHQALSYLGISAGVVFTSEELLNQYKTQILRTYENDPFPKIFAEDVLMNANTP